MVVEGLTSYNITRSAGWRRPSGPGVLTYDDQMSYSRIVTALKESIRLMAEIDAAIPKWPIE